MVELYRFVIVAILFAVACVVALKWVVLFLLRRAGIDLGGHPNDWPPWRRRIRTGTLVLGGLGLVSLMWAFIEPYYPQVIPEKQDHMFSFEILTLKSLKKSPGLSAFSPYTYGQYRQRPKVYIRHNMDKRIFYQLLLPEFDTGASSSALVFPIDPFVTDTGCSRTGGWPATIF